LADRETNLRLFTTGIKGSTEPSGPSVARAHDELLAFDDDLPALNDELLAFDDELLAFDDDLPAFDDDLPAFDDDLPALNDELPALSRLLALKARPNTAQGNALGLQQPNQSGSAEGATWTQRRATPWVQTRRMQSQKPFSDPNR
jgi:hypothetical protein